MQPYDEEKIADNDKLIRRVNRDQHIVVDKNRGGNRISSKLWSASPGMSVDILNLITNAKIDPYEFVTTPVFTASVSIRAGVAREAGLMVGYEPIIDHSILPDNPYHGEVWCEKGRNRLTNGQRNAMWDNCEWFVELPDTHLHRK